VGYLLVVVLFLAIPLGVVLMRLRRAVQGRHHVMLGVVMALLVPYVALLESFAAARGVIHPAEATNTIALLGLLPVEQYVFITLQVLVVGGVVLLLWRRLYPTDFE
jgi:hypothetical protein